MVAIQQSLLLDEVTEHQPVEHDRGVPVPVCHTLDAFDECVKRLMLGLESLKEPPGYPLDIEAARGTANDIRERQPLFLFERERDRREHSLKQLARGLSLPPDELPAFDGLILAAPNPLPELLCFGGVVIDDHVLAEDLGDLMIDDRSRPVLWNATAIVGAADERCEASLLRDATEGELSTGRQHTDRCLVAIPAQPLDEQRVEVKGIKQDAAGVKVKWHA